MFAGQKFSFWPVLFLITPLLPLRLFPVYNEHECLQDGEGVAVAEFKELDAPKSVCDRIEDAVFELMLTTPIPAIKTTDVVRLARTSKSTFYRYYKSVDDVVKNFEAKLLHNMQSINDVALEARFADSQLDPTPTMIRRMEVLRANREKVLALNSANGDPGFSHKATIFMHDYFRDRLQGTFSDETNFDLYLAFALAGHNNLIQYWLEVRPDIEPRTLAAALNRMFFAPLFVDETSRHWHPHIPDFD